MHILQPKHSKLKEKEIEELLNRLNISKSQFPKIFLNDSALPEGCKVGDLIKIERVPQTEIPDEKSTFYYRVVV
tara:strand:+ start:46 stop:267 length:222 start_codon:yes stop_codon:yes gene_type:complete